ncbi:MAG: proteobacterial dedicated sortase system histidine kinase [Granulosicoccaceae bacterium]|jgi:dedicated sortase system histidine kinase
MKRLLPPLRLRSKLLLITLILLAIPWTGYEYVREMERFLRTGMENNQLDQARAIATVLHERDELFAPRADLSRQLQSGPTLYARKLEQPVQLDGYTDEWQTLLEHSREYAAEHVLQSAGRYTPGTLSFQHLMGIWQRHLYVLFIVRDDHVVYRAPNSLHIDRSDHLQIVLEDKENQLQRYLVTTRAPGWVNAYLLDNEQQGNIAKRPEVRIKGEWQETADGYVLEMRIPLAMLGSRITFAVADVDRPLATVQTLVGTAGITQASELGTILTPSDAIETILQGLDRGESRIWITNTNGHVLALTGSLDAGTTTTPAQTEKNVWQNLLDLAYTAILTQPTSNFVDDLSGVSRLQGEDVRKALAGSAATRWRETPDKRVAILSAAHPVWSNGDVIGAVVIEQTSNRIVTLQNQAMTTLLNTTLVVFVTATLFLIMFASRLSNRIRRLHQDAEQAISDDGRVEGRIRQSSAGDEIGDLSRSFASVLERLAEYTRYLESMASKLSHEMRTPIAVVKSSLENLDMQALPGEASTYTGRAREGIDRLSHILTSMNEATRLEQAIQSTEREHFDLCELLGHCIQGYQLAYPGQPFALTTGDESLNMYGAPELIAQMLDKLIANAVDFSPDDLLIEIDVSRCDNRACISVSNSGPLLPENMQGQLFESMVSLREQSNDGVHLGIGLYVVRLIADYHNGKVEAKNRDDGLGVIFTVTLPLADD